VILMTQHFYGQALSLSRKSLKKVRSAIVRRSPQKPGVIPSFNGKVHGIIISDKLQKVLLSKSGEQPEWFQLNDKIDGWKIETIQSGSIILSQDGSTKSLSVKMLSHQNHL